MQFQPLAFPNPNRELEVDLSGCTVTETAARDFAVPELTDAIAKTTSLIDAGRPRAASAMLRSLHELHDSLPSEIRIHLTTLDAGLKLAVGDAIGSEKAILDTLAECHRSGIREPLLEAALLNNLGVIALRLYGKPEVAEDRFAAALTLSESTPDSPKRQRLVFQRNLGLVRDSRGDLEGAAAAYRAALRESDDDPVSGLNVVEILSANREHSGRPGEAENYLIAAFLNLRTWSTEFPRLFLRVSDDLCLHFLKKVDFDRLGNVAAEQASVCMKELPPAEHGAAVRPLTFAALSHWADERLFDAGEELRRISAIRRRVSDPTPSPVEIMDAVKALYEDLGIKRRNDVLTSFRSFAARLPY